MAANKGVKENVIYLRKKGYKMTDIAKELKCSLFTVKYHCSRNGLTGIISNLSITKEAFQQMKNMLKEGLTQKEISEKLSLSISTIKRYKNKEYDDIINGRKYMSNYMFDKRKELKIKAIEYKGGCCSMCGYNKSVLSLSFHHIDPNTKDFQISGITRSWDKIKKEVDKCILVCNNCHGEIHEKENIKG